MTNRRESSRRPRAAAGQLHWLDAEGRVACNPRDREAAHRAEMQRIATEDPAGVTCRKCLEVIRRNEDATPGRGHS